MHRENVKCFSQTELMYSAVLGGILKSVVDESVQRWQVS